LAWSCSSSSLIPRADPVAGTSPLHLRCSIAHSWLCSCAQDCRPLSAHEPLAREAKAAVLRPPSSRKQPHITKADFSFSFLMFVMPFDLS
jgi:hypothetical protein